MKLLNHFSNVVALVYVLADDFLVNEIDDAVIDPEASV